MAKSLKERTYSQAISELEKLLQELDSDSVDIDRLSEKVKQAAGLIAYLRKKLTMAETEVKKVLQDFNGDYSSSSSSE